MKRFHFHLPKHLTCYLPLFFFFTSTVCLQARAQLLSGFFSQQSRKEKLMAEQIAAYRFYLEELRAGTNAARAGLTEASSLKNGTRSLHRAYFNSLRQVGVPLQSNTKAKAIPAIGQQIIKAFRAEIAFQQKTNMLTPAEQDEIGQVYQGLVKKCDMDLLELRDILTPGRLQLTDQQRLERIDHLYSAMQDKLSYTGSFTARSHQLALWRQQEAKDRQIIRKLYGGAQ
jgi:hypothetical protein